MFPSFEILAAIQGVFVLVGLFWMLRRNDEIPLLAGSFLFYVGCYRYWAVKSGHGRWVQLSNFGFQDIGRTSAHTALGLMVLGQTCFMVAYLLVQRDKLPVIRVRDFPDLFARLRPKVLALGLLSLPLAIFARSRASQQAAAGRSLAFEVSGYVMLLPLMLVGTATLILCLWRFKAIKDPLSKGVAVLVLVGLASLSFSTSGRFQFLGWMIAGSIVLSCTYRAQVRLALMTGVAIVALAIFTLAGALRYEFGSSGELQEATWRRAFAAEDANMLDGFVLLRQVYPKLLDFRWGMEHVEVLLRPIPRTWWPDKPAGSYMFKLGLLDAGSGFSLGISPTLFGSFYSEGGIAGMIVLALVYGVVIALVVRSTLRMHPFAAVLVKALPCASLVPLLRGGDLPGVYAWIGMAFWPCLLVLWVYRYELLTPAPVETKLSPETSLPSMRPRRLPHSRVAAMTDGWRNRKTTESSINEPPASS